MNYLKRLTSLYNKSDIINFNEKSRFIIMSDCHRGDGNWSDSFAKNQNIYAAALTHYFKEDYTYIELGDGDELWEYRNINDIIQEHSNVYWLLKKFHDNKKLHMIYGNHDVVKRNPAYVEKYYYKYFNQRENKYIDLFENIKMYEALILKHEKLNIEVFLLHGHQVDFLNSYIWLLARFLVRYFWKPLENFCLKDVTRTAKNYKKKKKVARRLTEWVIKENKMLIAGHNHRPMFPEINEPPYFNDGSCVHPRCITGIEIRDNCISLVKWSVKASEQNNLLIEREVLAGPENLQHYLKDEVLRATLSG